VTFAKRKITFYRMYSFGLNIILLSSHMIKERTDGEDMLENLAYDMTVKEPMGLADYRTDRVGFEPFTIKGDSYSIDITPKDEFDREEFKAVYNVKELGSHPFVLDIDFDVYEFHEDEALTLL